MHFVIVLDNLRSAHNVGSIFRTADALAVEKIWLCGTTPCPGVSGPLVSLKASKELAKTALGAEKSVPWEYQKRITGVLKTLRKQDFKIVGLEQTENSVNLFKFKAPIKLALVIGNEVTGVAKVTLHQCDKIIEIPMSGQKESLNVAVAFGVAGYWIKSEKLKNLYKTK